MVKHENFSLTDPEVQALLEGVLLSTKGKYFTSENGKTTVYPIKRHLIEDLKIEPSAATVLLAAASASMQRGDFIRNKTKAKAP